MRNVVIGKNSKVWSALAGSGLTQRWHALAIGHQEVRDFRFLPEDRVWLFSYSPIEAANEQIIDRVQAAQVKMLVYVSSSSVVVAESTRCYAYPRTKLAAERYAAQFENAKILTLGLVYENAIELPAGDNVATSIESLAKFLIDPSWECAASGRHLLFERYSKPFSSEVEQLLYRTYGAVINSFRKYPCLLRPLDILLKYAGYRWYGYTYLSNKLWMRSILS